MALSPKRARTYGRLITAAVAVAPFFVKADYFWDSGTLAGEGASVLYLWCGGWGTEILRWNVLAI